MTSLSTEAPIVLDHAIQHRPTSRLVIQDLEFESNITIAEADELAGEGFLSGLAGAAVGGLAGATAGIASYATGQLYDGATGRGWSWSWRDAGRDVAVGTVAGAVSVGTTAFFIPTP